MDKRKIILDVDTGTDDAMAIICAMLAREELDILGITVVQGNQPLKYTLENTLRVVSFMGGGIPVYGGCPDPMVQNLSAGRMSNQRIQHFEVVKDGKKVNVHDEYLDLPETDYKPENMHAVSYLVETLRNTKEKITLIPVGPATNIGMAIRMAPDIVENIEEIICMGGGVAKANRTSAAEMNFYMDPDAAHIMVKAGCKVTILPLDCTTSALFNKEDAKKIKDVGNAPAKFYGDLVEHFIDRLTLLGINNDFDINDYSIAMHDVICVLYLLDPTVVTDIRKEKCDVDFAGGFADGQLIVDSRIYTPRDEETYVCYVADKQKILDMVIELLKRY